MVTKNKDSVPEGIWILSSVWFIGALIILILGGFMFSLFDVLRGGPGFPLVDPVTNSTTGYVPAPVFIGLGILFVAFAVFGYYVGRGLLNSKNWARIVIAVLAVFGILIAIVRIVNLNFASGLFSLILYGLIIWYLFFKESTKKFFK